jgi:hypothetical protein
MARTIALLAFVMLLAGCSDAATRIAFDLEQAADQLASGRAERATVEHVPQAMPEGCAGAYSLQLSAASVLVIWCRDATGAATVSSHATTYHLRFVDVPQTLRIDKPAGAPVWIDLVRSAGKPQVTGLR